MENLLKKLDLTSLRLFVAVCQEQNIARAAEREFIASSAVSRRIAEIEALIGLPVIQRQSRGITVTPVGETVLRYALAIIGNIEQMSAELSRFSSGAKGRVRVVANLSSIVQFLPEDVAAFGRVFPEVSIELEEENSADVLRIVDEHGADFGICNAVAGSEAFEQVPYREDRLAVLVPGGHRLADVSRVAFDELLDDSFVGLRSESALTQASRAAGGQRGAADRRQDPRQQPRCAVPDGPCRPRHRDRARAGGAALCECARRALAVLERRLGGAASHHDLQVARSVKRQRGGAGGVPRQQALARGAPRIILQTRRLRCRTGTSALPARAV